MAWAFGPAQTPSPGQGRRRQQGRLSIWARRAMKAVGGAHPAVKRKCVGEVSSATGGGSAPSSPPSWPCSSSGRWARLGGSLGLGMGWIRPLHAEGKRPARQEELIRARSAAPRPPQRGPASTFGPVPPGPYQLPGSEGLISGVWGEGRAAADDSLAHRLKRTCSRWNTGGGVGRCYPSRQTFHQALGPLSTAGAIWPPEPAPWACRACLTTSRSSSRLLVSAACCKTSGGVNHVVLLPHLLVCRTTSSGCTCDLGRGPSVNMAAAL
ncbi:hypothetical protein GWK47_052791 [Chionoecetes opilio]|uniref:Uncharacterized protein n=1 Tax=Chionoecetes opilio TaxID=41210 RepID=A0A8J4Y6R7_CHIOP|nr:hypothetical protein GWK47_052791 [Chionoecetes opilio]